MSSCKQGSMRTLLKRFVRCTEAQDVIEYALLAAFISIVGYGAFVAIGGNVDGIYSTTQTATASASNSTVPEAGNTPPNGNPPNGNPPNGNPPNGNPPNGNPPNGNPPNGNPPNGNPPNGNPPNGNPPKK